MKTTVTRLKTLIQNNNQSGQTLSYVKYVEIIHPDILIPNISLTLLPSIFFTPISTEEEWVASQEKQATHIVKAYLVMRYNQRELSIIGDATRTQGQGMLDFVNDFLSVVRGTRLAVNDTQYLDKPLEIQNVDYIREDLGENSFLIIADITMLCVRIFLQTSLPGNI